ncbi:hypothetical protein HID58_066966, partial [Brassica napus]
FHRNRRHHDCAIIYRLRFVIISFLKWFACFVLMIHLFSLADNAEKKVKSSYFDLPAMNVFVAFPQATPASKFPTCTSDYYHFNELLTPKGQAVRKRVSEFMEKEVAPIMTEVFYLCVCLFTLILSLRDIILLSLIFTHQYWEKAEFPFHIIPKLGALGVVGGSIKGCGCPGLSITANAIATADISRVDASCGTFNLVHTSLDMLTIVRQIRSTTISKMHKICQIPQIVEFLGSGEVVRIETSNGWCLPVDSLPSYVHCAITPAQLGISVYQTLDAEFANELEERMGPNNNINDDLEVTLTITYYNQNATETK